MGAADYGLGSVWSTWRVVWGDFAGIPEACSWGRAGWWGIGQQSGIGGGGRGRGSVVVVMSIGELAGSTHGALDAAVEQPAQTHGPWPEEFHCR